MLYADKAIGEAFRRTRLFFFKPFSLKRWLKLGLVGIFGGVLQQGGGGSFTGNDLSNLGNSGGDNNCGTSEMGQSVKKAIESLETFYREHSLMIFAIAGVTIIIFIALSLLVTYIRSTMFFVFIESLVQRNVSVLGSFRNNRGKGFSLFLFNVLMRIIFLPIIFSLWNMINSHQNINIWAFLSSFLLSFIAFLILIIIFNFICSLTYDFAVPICYSGESGIPGGWITLLGLMRSNPGQIAFYYLIKIALAIGTGFIMVPLSLILLIIFIPIIMIAVIFYVIVAALFVKSQILGIIAGIIVTLLFIMAILVISYLFFCVYLPVHVFFRFYALVFLEMLTERVMNFGKAYEEENLDQFQGLV